MTIVKCILCEHYINDYTCDAFPEGIPEAIRLDEHDHREPFKGDNGIRFEPIPDDDETENS